MNKALKLYIGLLVLLLVGAIYMERSKPKPTDWTPTYAVDYKTPLGLYVLNQEIDHVFANDTLYRVETTPYEYFSTYYDVYYKTEEEQLYYPTGRAFLTIDHHYTIDDLSTQELLNFVTNGNVAFLSMNDFSATLLDTLKVGYTKLDQESTKSTRWVSTLRNPKKYAMSQGIMSGYFHSLDTLYTTILGHKTMEGIDYVNFIKVPFGLGFIYLHLEPAAFSNVYLLQEHHEEYAQNVLSCIDSRFIILYLRGFHHDEQQQSQSPLRYILSKPALKWAWYLFLLGMFIFMLFRAKRAQRVIPIIEPLRNTTVDFVKTIANLYYQEQDHHHMIDKKIIYFLDKIRRDYFIDTTVLDVHFINKLHQKTGKDIKIIEKLVFLIEQHRIKESGSSVEDDLIAITNTIYKILH